MGLLSIFQRKSTSNKPGAESTADAVQLARTRARRRLIGAALLVGVGIIGFPVLFETQPRPIAVDVPIVIPSKEGVPPLVARSERGSPAASESGKSDGVLTETQAEAGREVPPAAEPKKSPAAVVADKRPEAAEASKSKPEDKPEAKSIPKPEVKPEAKPASKTVASKDAERAKALLEGKAVAKAEASAKRAEPAAGSTRVVVQVGAFADAAAARQVRQQVEKLGLKTFVQEVSTSSGKRVRVRVGPYTSRDEADKVAGKIKAAGLAAVVLTL